MQNQSPAILCLAIIATAIALSGCTQPDDGQQDGAGQYRAGPDGGLPPGGMRDGRSGGFNRSMNRSGNFSANMSDEQRMQFDQMRQQATDACNGKAPGDGCIMQSPRGERNGTCQERNSFMQCAGGTYGNRQFPPN